MPTYGYRCPNGHEVEVVHRMVDAPPIACEICGASPIQRIFHPISTSFTGSGFYATDYGRGGEKSEAAAGDSVKPSGDSAKTDEKGTKEAESPQK